MSLSFIPFTRLSGIEPRGNVVLKPAEFLVETVEAGLGEVLVYVEDPEGHTEEVGTHTLGRFSQTQQSETQLRRFVFLSPSGPGDPQQRQEQNLLRGLPAQSGGAS